VRAYLNALEPGMLILAETEFWPNLLNGCFRRGIPCRGGQCAHFGPVVAEVRDAEAALGSDAVAPEPVLAQSETDAERLRALGCREEAVSVAGNLKFDVRASQEAEATRRLRAVGLRFVVAGSTLDGEETALLESWPRVAGERSALAMVLAPRHPERSAPSPACWNGQGSPG
jgi:3-deoxy-D-manno-octulosonic-acid transferase